MSRELVLVEQPGFAKAYRYRNHWIAQDASEGAGWIVARDWWSIQEHRSHKEPVIGYAQTLYQGVEIVDARVRRDRLERKLKG